MVNPYPWWQSVASSTLLLELGSSHCSCIVPEVKGTGLDQWLTMAPGDWEMQLQWNSLRNQLSLGWAVGRYLKVLQERDTWEVAIGRTERKGWALETHEFFLSPSLESKFLKQIPSWKQESGSWGQGSLGSSGGHLGYGKCIPQGIRMNFSGKLLFYSPVTKHCLANATLCSQGKGKGPLPCMLGLDSSCVFMGLYLLEAPEDPKPH
jgi:hypothetical protein